jgi:hypothetical protein
MTLRKHFAELPASVAQASCLWAWLWWPQVAIADCRLQIAD